MQNVLPAACHVEKIPTIQKLNYEVKREENDMVWGRTKRTYTRMTKNVVINDQLLFNELGDHNTILIFHPYTIHPAQPITLPMSDL